MPGGRPNCKKKKKKSGNNKKHGKKTDTSTTDTRPTTPFSSLEQTNTAKDDDPPCVAEEETKLPQIEKTERPTTERMHPAPSVEEDSKIAPSEDEEQVTAPGDIKSDQTAENIAPTTPPQLPTIVEEDETTPTRKPKLPHQNPSKAAETVADPEKTPTGVGFPFRSAVNQQPAPPTPSREKFYSDNFHLDTRCRNPECGKSTHPLDGSTKICPACGPRSKVRYCSKACLYLDIRRHFMNECGTLTIEGEIDETCLDDSNKNVRPYIRHSTQELVNTVERHRQAAYFAMESEGEYFIFDDVEEAYNCSSNPSREQLQEARELGRLTYTVVAPDERTRQNFDEALGHSLSRGANGMFVRGGIDHRGPAMSWRVQRADVHLSVHAIGIRDWLPGSCSSASLLMKQQLQIRLKLD